MPFLILKRESQGLRPGTTGRPAPAAGRCAARSVFVVLADEDALYEDARGVDVIGVQRAWLDELFDLGDRHAAGGGHHRIKVARRLAVDEVAEAVAFSTP